MKKQYKYLLVAFAILVIAVAGFFVTKHFSVKKVVKTPFGVTQTAVYFYPSVESSKASNNTVTVTPKFYDDISIALGNIPGWSDTDQKIKKASIENIKIVKQPSIGGFSLFKPTNDPKAPFSSNPKYNISNSKRYDISIVPQNINTEFIPDSIGQLGGIIHLYYYSDSFKSLTKPSDQAVDFITAMKDLAVSNNDLAAKITFDIQLVNAKNQTFIKHIELALPASDINNKNTYSSSKMFDAESNMFDVKK